ncbi:MAG TPA: hypothetical protein VFD05_02935 [Bacilli bacterium]|nr:hypothetical protein [Bacilli bacterium]
MYILASLYEQGIYFEKDMKKAISLFEDALNHGYKDARKRLKKLKEKYN